jgi:hypothetical protein
VIIGRRYLMALRSKLVSFGTLVALVAAIAAPIFH